VFPSVRVSRVSLSLKNTAPKFWTFVPRQNI
jgi:hypothetical protein